MTDDLPFRYRDYVSPGLRVVLPDAAFPHMRAGDPWRHPWPHLRREVPHRWYADERHPLMGFLNRDEAAILHNVALRFAGRPALEIGSWLGWSTCHLALAGVTLDVIDPAHEDPALRASVEASLAACGVADRVRLTPGRSPDAVHALAARADRPWSLFFIDGDHEGDAPARDALACLPHAAPDCAFLFHDLASPAVAAGLRALEREGFRVLVYQTAQIMGLAWRGDVAPVPHVPDPDVAWQLPHHLIGLPVAGAALGERAHHAIGRGASFVDSLIAPSVEGASIAAPPARPTYRELPELEQSDGDVRGRSVCIVSSEIVGPFKNGGIGTSMTGLAEHLAAAGCRVTVLYTGALSAPDVPVQPWVARYADLGIELVALGIDALTALDGPLRAHGFVAPYLVYRWLAAGGRRFDVVHFNDCGGEGSLCTAAKRMGLAFADTLLLVALHSPSEWVLSLNGTLPVHRALAAYAYAERLSVRCADAVWCPSRYLVDWVVRHDFVLPAQAFVQQYALPTQRLRADGASDGGDFPEPARGRTPPPAELVFFGRLEERKGLRVFCNAVHRLRGVLAAGNVTVTFLGKPETCGGMGSLAYLARRAESWDFPVRTITDLGQPEALAYLRAPGRLAVMPSRVDNSPCTVYEALAWGIPFLAARAGGVPELIDAADHAHVLFDHSTGSLAAALDGALRDGGWIATPARPQPETRRVWRAFHAHAARYLPSPDAHASARPRGRVVAIVDGAARDALDATLRSLDALDAVDHVVVLDRAGAGLSPTRRAVRHVDLLVDDPEALDAELDALAESDVVLLIHAGVAVRADALEPLLAALDRAPADGLLPAGEIVSARERRTIPPLGGAPAFTLFEGVTFTGGCVVRGGALARARLGRELAVGAAFMGLADFCVTRGAALWPYPEPLFDCPDGWTGQTARPSPARVRAYDECAPDARYYMLAAGYGGTEGARAGARLLRVAVALLRLGLRPVVRVTAGAARRWHRLRARLDLPTAGHGSA